MKHFEVGKRLKEIRKRLGIKAVDLARESGIAHSFLSEIEQGKKDPSLQTLGKICYTLGISLSQFFAGEISSGLVPTSLRPLVNAVQELNQEQLEVIEELAEILVKKNRKHQRTPIALVAEDPAPYPSPTHSKESEEEIDIHSIPMAAHVEGADSVPMTPGLKKILKDGIREARRRKRERLAREKEQAGKSTKATTDE